MLHLETGRPISAITYTDGERAAQVLHRLWMKLVAGGASCAGFVQRDDVPVDGGSRCDMVLECVSTGERVKISENRGRFARGCRLDMAELMRALSKARNALLAKPDVLIVNKFGKSEGEGGGFRPLIADAIERAIPVLIAVPWRNIESWRLFAGELANEVTVEALQPEYDRELLLALGISFSPGTDAASQWPEVPLPGKHPG
ncbi:MAG: DUF2478 domain-containing protein [Hyphomicrobiaceae bacterium]